MKLRELNCNVRNPNQSHDLIWKNMSVKVWCKIIDNVAAKVTRQTHDVHIRERILQ
jgi:hypothetical protein